MTKAVFQHDESTARTREVAVAVKLALPGLGDDEIEESLRELALLADTAGADVACTLVQRRNAPCPGTLFGKGKIEELRAAVEELEADLVLVDCDLSPKQGSNLEKLLKVKVVDRTQLILDIFAQHAHTAEGKNQVELAQLEYALPRLAGRGSIMRQQGGIGVRGPGEQKLEVDRRVIRNRIRRLKRELDSVRKHRRIQRKKRVEGTTGTVALVGYTNSGKSCTLNALSGSNVRVADRLFATLDPRSRKCTLPSGRTVILTDTVGFVRDLPHTLVAAFRATLEEVNEADLLLLVADASHPFVEEQIKAVYTVLDEIKVSGKLTVIVYNKIDVADRDRVAQLMRNDREAAISARTGEGLESLLLKIDALFATQRQRVRLRIPQGEAKVVGWIFDHGRVLRQEYDGDHILLEAEVDGALERQVSEYLV